MPILGHPALSSLWGGFLCESLVHVRHSTWGTIPLRIVQGNSGESKSRGLRDHRIAARCVHHGLCRQSMSDGGREGCLFGRRNMEKGF